LPHRRPAARFGEELQHERLVDVRRLHTVVDEVEQLLSRRLARGQLVSCQLQQSRRQ
jgi:hypothetical protein